MPKTQTAIAGVVFGLALLGIGFLMFFDREPKEDNIMDPVPNVVFLDQTLESCKAIGGYKFESSQDDQGVYAGCILMPPKQD